MVNTYDPFAPDELGWNDPALFAAMRDESCVVMTAWNPGFRELALQENKARNERMYEVLSEQRMEIWPAESAARGGIFAESGFLIWQMPVELAVAIAKDFEQFAIYFYSAEGERTVVPCELD